MNAAKLIDRFHLLGDAPSVVEQLRKLIVVLAVGGKFASADFQGADPTLLFEELSKRRCSLTKGVGLRKQESPVVTLEDLPAGFSNPKQFVRLAYIARIEKGPTGIQKAQPGPYPLVVTAAERLTCDHYDFEGAAALIPLVSSTGHGNARLNRLHYQEGKFALGSILAGVFPYFSELYSARFLFEYLTAFKEELLVSRMTGTANVTLTIGRIADVPVPLLHPVTQRQVEELMGLCDQLEAARDKRESRRDRLVAGSLHRLSTPSDEDEGNTQDVFRDHARFVFDNLPRLTARQAHIKQLRQTILNLAVRGKLVEQDANDEPAENCLAISDETRRKISKSDHRADSSNQPLLAPELRWDIPNAWRWRGLADLVLFIDYRGKTPQKVEAGIRLITAKNVKQGFINLHPEEFVTADVYNDWMTRGIPTDGDVLFTTEAPMGNAAVVRFPGRFALAQRVIDFRPYGAVDPDFLVLQLLSAPFQSILDVTATGLTAKGIKAAKLKRLPIALPPLAEQQRIVDKVDELMALCDQLESQLTTNEADSRRLLEAVLQETLKETADA